MSAKRVWAVSAGCYSDYSVICLFGSKKDAELHASDLRGDPEGWRYDARAESFLLFDDQPKRVTVWTITGRVVDGREVADRMARGLRSEEEWEYGYLYGEPKPMMQARTYCPPIDKGVGQRVEVRGSNKTQVLKAYGERIAAAKAAGA